MWLYISVDVFFTSLRVSVHDVHVDQVCTIFFPFCLEISGCVLAFLWSFFGDVLYLIVDAVLSGGQALKSYVVVVYICMDG